MAARRFIDFDVPGGELSVWCHGPVGSSQAILLVHDVAANGRVWDLVMDRLPDDIVILAPDLRGRGASVHLLGQHGLAAHAGDLLWMLDQANVTRILAVGHGFGAAVVEAIAIEDPERVPVRISINNVDREYVDPFVHEMSATFSSRDDHRQFWRSHPRLSSVPWGPAIEAFVDHGLLGVGENFRWRIDACAVQKDLDDWSATIPALVAPRESAPPSESIVGGGTSRVIDVGPGPSTGHLRLPWADMATLPLTVDGADAIARMIGPMISRRG